MKRIQERGNIMEKMKNIDKAEILVLKEQVDYQKQQIVSKTLVQNEYVSITLFAFDRGAKGMGEAS